MKQLYQQKLHDHFQNPRNWGRLEKPDFSSDILNPSCGDAISFQGTVIDGSITDLAFEGAGCIICLATASILSELSKGKPVDYILKLGKKEIQDIIGMKLGPIRLKCALLPLQALQQGILSISK